MRPLVFLVAAAAASFHFTFASAQAPDSLSFQGLLTSTDGAPVDSSDVSITFTLYKGATPVWTETQVVNVEDGIYNVLLGSVTPLDTVRFNQAIDLGVKLDGEVAEMSPRTPLAAAAYAKALPGLYTFFHQQSTSLSYNVVGGGSNNSVGSNVTGATISGGGGIAFGSPGPNQVLERFGTVGGGSDNTASGLHSTIGGGSENSAGGGESVIGGGRANMADGTRSVVSGGGPNTASGDRSFVGGGQGNSANGDYSTIAGGRDNTASGNRSTVVGGGDGSASGDYSTVLGGHQNSAGANNTVAIGYRADVDHAGSFVWQDSSGSGSLPTTAANQFLARASGGFTFLTSAASVVTAAGAELPAGSGAWADLSSESSKTAFEPIDTRNYLDGVASLEIRKWSYKTEDPTISHVGPMAEDFHATFGHGHNNTSITTVDASGVAMAAIQGLYEIVKEQQAEIDRLKRLLIADH